MARDREDFIFREDFIYLFDANLSSGIKSSRSCWTLLSGIPPVGGHAGCSRTGWAPQQLGCGAGGQPMASRSLKLTALCAIHALFPSGAELYALRELAARAVASRGMW